jgi:hypothetical protein
MEKADAVVGMILIGQLHRLRFKFFDFAATPSMTPDERSGPPTPIEAALPGLSSGGLKA